MIMCNSKWERASAVLSFILSLISLIISLILLRLYGAYEIEYGGGTLIINGGWFMVVMNVIRLVALFVLCISSGIKLYKGSR